MTYRDEREAVEIRRALISRRLAEITEQSSAARALEAEAATLRAQLADADARLAEGPRRLPLLDALQIATPCSARWEDMPGDARARHCAACDKNVFNLESMTRAEAERLLFETEGRVCVRLYRRKDGTVLTADCAVGVRRKRRRIAVIALAGTALAGAVAMAGAMIARPLAPDGTMTRTVGALRAMESLETKPPETPAIPATPSMGEPAMPGPVMGAPPPMPQRETGHIRHAAPPRVGLVAPRGR